MPRALAADIANGDFASGDFAGWTIFAEDQSLAATPPLIEVAELSAGFAASFPTGPFTDGVFLQFIQQSYLVDSDRPILFFDMSPAEWSPDVTGGGSSTLIDELFVTVGSTLHDQIEPILVDRFGVVANPIDTATGLVSLGEPSQPSEFEIGVAVDLAQFAGKEVMLTIDVIQQDDGFKFDQLLLGNFAMHAVPEPSSSALFVLAILTLAIACFRSA